MNINSIHYRYNKNENYSGATAIIPVGVLYVYQMKLGEIARLYIDGLVQNCSNSSVLAMALLHSCTQPSIWLRSCTKPSILPSYLDNMICYTIKTVSLTSTCHIKHYWWHKAGHAQDNNTSLASAHGDYIEVPRLGMRHHPCRIPIPHYRVP